MTNRQPVILRPNSRINDTYPSHSRGIFNQSCMHYTSIQEQVERGINSKFTHYLKRASLCVFVPLVCAEMHQRHEDTEMHTDNGMRVPN